MISRRCCALLAAALVASPIAAARRADGQTAESEKSARSGGLFALGSPGRKTPLSIRSEELEAFQSGKERRFVFKQNVKVQQGDVTLTADHLEAFYSGSASEPERLVASGGVVLTERDKRAQCDRATYVRGAQRILCEGHAQLEQGADRVRGEEIEFHLDSERVVVRGGADVHLHGGDARPGGEGG